MSTIRTFGRGIPVVVLCVLEIGLAPVSAQPQSAGLVPSQFHFSVDIAGQTGRYVTRGTCASQPVTHDAPIWSVVVSLRVQPPEGTVRIDPNLNIYHRGSVQAVRADTLYVPYFEGASATVPLAHAGRRFTGNLRLVLGTARFEVQGLTLSEVGEVVELLAGNPNLIQGAFTAGNTKLRVFKVWDPTGQADADDVLEALYSNFDPASDPLALIKGLEAATIQPQTVEFVLEDDTMTVTLQSVIEKAVGPRVQAFEIDKTSLDAARGNVRTLAERGKGSQPGDSNPPIWIVDEPCFQLSLAPVISGDEVSTAAAFRGRYDFLTRNGKGFLKIRAEGDGSQGGDYFQRVEARSELGLNQQASAWLLAFSGVGSYSFTREGGETLDEWKLGGKLQVHTPNLTGKLSALPGASTSPILAVEFGAAGGNGPSTGETNAYAMATLMFTSRPSTRLYLDANAAAGWSNERRFGGESTFEYIKVTARFNISSDWDYLVRYECGEKNPDYQSFCGWQTGADLTTGR